MQATKSSQQRDSLPKVLWPQCDASMPEPLTENPAPKPKVKTMAAASEPGTEYWLP